MAYVMISILSVIFLFLIIRICRMKSSVKSLTAQVRDISTCDTNLTLRNEIGIKAYDPLIKEVNKLLADARDKCIAAQRLNKSFRDSITNISHDLRTPLTAAGGYTAMLRDEGLSGEKRLEYIAIIEDRQDVTRRLLDQLFYYARMESDSINMKNEPVDIRAVFENTIAMYYNAFTIGNSEPTVDIEPIPMVVSGDADAFSRIFSNIVSNALRHGLGDYAATLKKDGDSYVLTFSNASEEMSDYAVRMVFDRFYTPAAARTKSGTGLGLAIAKELTERMKGSIEAAYALGTFTITVRFPAD